MSLALVPTFYGLFSLEMPSTPNRNARTRPGRPSNARTRHAAEREERKEHGTPEKTRTPRRRTQSSERTPRRERTAQKRTRSPDRKSRRIVVEEEYESQSESEQEPRTPQKRRDRSPARMAQTRRRSPERKSKKFVMEEKHRSYESDTTARGSNPLSIESLAKLDALNETTGGRVKEREKRDKVWSEKKTVKEKVVTERVAKEKVKHRRRSDGTYGDRERRRVVSGPLLEEGRSRRARGGYVSTDERSGKRKFGRKCWIAFGVLGISLLILIPVAIVVSKKKSGTSGGSVSSGSGSDPSNSNLNGVSENDIPTAAKNTILDPFTWYDTTSFNVTYTNDTVGGLSIMGLNSTWNDTTQANQFVPALNKAWAYGTMPIRGVNLGGWLSIEPFITPSLFNTYKTDQNIVDEYSLTTVLGPTKAAQVLEKHYSQFITEHDFASIQAAGFDHVRIPYSYWAVTTYPGDPYVSKISWRYLLRGIEYARQYGLRVNLDLHALPGSQNGWNHSGRQGPIGWLNGTDGALNAQRSLDLHTQLSTFFAQPRYQNVVTIYGLVNEPKMTALSQSAVVGWTASAAQIVRKSGMNQTIAFGDGFLGLSKWQGQLQGITGMVLDAHEYTIFDPNLIVMNHTAKVQYACTGWTGQMKLSEDTTTG